MSRSNLSPRCCGLAEAMLIICVLAHEMVETVEIKLHMGILETRRDDQIIGHQLEIELADEQEFMQQQVELRRKDNDYYRPLQCSYALSALRQLRLTEQILYGSNGEFQYVPDYDFLVFDAESVSMLATVHNLPLDEPNLRGILMKLWFYADRVRRLLEAASGKDASRVDSLDTRFMCKAHQSIETSLLVFLTFNMGKFKNVQRKLDEITAEKFVDRRDRVEVILENKRRLNAQIAFNKNFGVSTEGEERVSFEALTALDKSVEIGSIVAEYFGRNYWNAVENKMRTLYTEAMNLDLTISCQITKLWHVRNGTMKVLKLIVNRFVSKYLDYLVNSTDSSDPDNRPDKVIVAKLSEYHKCVGRSASEGYESLPESVSKSGDDFSMKDFYVGVKGDIDREQELYPLCTSIENISDYYSLLAKQSDTTVSMSTEEWQNIDAFIGKVKTLFSEAHTNVCKSFDAFPISSTTFDRLKDYEYQ